MIYKLFLTILLCRKPTTHKAKKAILKKEPKLIETAKETLCLKGQNTSPIVVGMMKDLVSTRITLKRKCEA